MANEITVTVQLSSSNSGFESSQAASRISIDQTAIGSQGGPQNIGTTYEAINLGNVTTEGIAMITNRDSSNFVQIGTDGGSALVPFIKLLPGEPCLFRVDPTVTLYALADTAACNIDVLILEA